MKRFFYTLFIVFLSTPIFAQLPKENEKGKFGYVDENDNYIIKPRWDEADDFYDGFARVKKGNVYGFINETGAYVVKPKYTFVGNYDENQICKVGIGGKEDKKTGVLVGVKYGFIDRSLNEVIKPKYSFVGEPDKNGICWVNIGGKIYTASKFYAETDNVYGGKWGYMQLPSGKELTKLEYSRLKGSFSDSGYSWVQKGKKYGFIDNQGNTIIEAKYEAIQDTFTNNAVWVRPKLKKEKFGFIDNNGRTITEIKYALAFPFSDNCAAVIVRDKKKKKYFGGYINTEGKYIVEPIYNKVMQRFHDKISAVQKDDRWAFINTSGEIISDFEYKEIVFYNNNKGFTHVTKNGTKDKAGNIASGDWGIANNQGKLLTPLKYRLIGGVNAENLMRVSDGTNWGWVNLQGEEVIPLKYSASHDFNDGLAVVIENGKASWINPQNKIILKTDYADASIFQNGVACVKDASTKKWGAIDIKGNILVPFFTEDVAEARNIVDTMYLKKKKPLTKRDVKLYTLYYRERPQDKFKIVEIIPTDMWDF